MAISQGISGKISTPGVWSYTVRHPGGSASRAFFRRIAMLPMFIKRIQGVYLECRDWRDVIEKHDAEDTVFYLDPPYPPISRRAPEAYLVEMTDDDHRELIDTILQLKGMVMISSYPNPIYEALDAHGWKRYEYSKPLCASNKRVSEAYQITEAVWCNPQLENARIRNELLI